MAKRIAIVGSRNWPDLEQVVEFVNSLPLDTVIVSGGAHGVDKTAENAALARGMKVDIRLPRVERGVARSIYVAALMARNTEIVRDADLVVGFWFQGSSGTRDSLKKAIGTFRKPVRIFTIHGEVPQDKIRSIVWGE